METGEIEVKTRLTVYIISIEGIINDSNRYDNMSAIYMLVKGNEIVYVGRTNNLRKRIQVHKRKVKCGLIDDRVCIIAIDHKHICNIELAVIEKIQPIGNRIGNPRRDVYAEYYY